MDVEDWYHLNYFQQISSPSWSMLDGLDRFAEFLEEENIRATFFCLGELVGTLHSKLSELHTLGHEIGSHGPDHNLSSDLKIA
jgi:peptidoglycan/xylan/chitin deacetylase (PgdA/CDA1 family)